MTTWTITDEGRGVWALRGDGRVHDTYRRPAAEAALAIMIARSAGTRVEREPGAESYDRRAATEGRGGE